MDTLLQVIHQHEQDHTLECECHGRDVETLYRVRDDQGSDPIDLCLATYLESNNRPEVA